MTLSISDLVPHRPPMLLLDTLLDCGPGFARATVSIDRESSFFEPGRGVPAYLAIEYCAQAIAVIAGEEARVEGLPPPVGYLLGTRKFTCTTGWFPEGTHLVVEAREELYDDSGMCAYNCTLQGPGIDAECRLTVFRPPLKEST